MRSSIFASWIYCVILISASTVALEDNEIAFSEKSFAYLCFSSMVSWEILTDEDVLRLVDGENEAETDGSDDSDIETIELDPPKISVADAIRGLETALSFMEQEPAENGDELVATKRTIMRLMTSDKGFSFPVITAYAFIATAILVLFFYYCIGYIRSIYSDEMNNVGNEHMYGFRRGLNFDASLFIV
ncbi:hypothetical protein DdX_15612 [Ditylenchus destructor]|uniref:Uncharacterized protein n=1 Tax=Ditylenchus destructor TaxID=166010 RepID=A0AAD4MRU8_9BILA|nr:hypothetical protein DdX_15612 [Ditylenchus destructor]